MVQFVNILFMYNVSSSMNSCLEIIFPTVNMRLSRLVSAPITCEHDSETMVTFDGPVCEYVIYVLYI